MRITDLLEAPKWRRVSFPTSNNNIDDIMEFYFKTPGGYSIDKNIVNVNGNCKLKKSVNKLPVNFGEVTGNFICDFKLKTPTLEGSPKKVGGRFSCIGNSLKTLEGGPIETGDYACNHGNILVNLNDLPNIINGILTIDYHKLLPLLKVIFVKNLVDINFDIYVASHNETEIIIQSILRKYLEQGRKGALQCAAELTRAGFKGNARL